MSSFIIHLLIPTLLALSTGLFRLRTAWAWSWAAWAVDIDYLGWVAHVNYGWPNVHRALFHNVWLLLLAAGLGVRAWTRWSAQGGASFAAFAGTHAGWVLVPFYYATHLLLDLFAGGVVPLWPLSTRTVFWDFTIDVDTSRPVPQPQITSEPGTFVGVPDVSRVYTWMTAEEFAIFLLYAATLVLVYWRWVTEQRAAAPAEAPRPRIP